MLDRNSLKIILAVLFMFAVNSQADAQNVAVKTNVLGDAIGSLNIGIEARLADRWTMDLSGHLDPWTRKDNALWRHEFIQPEARWWFCDTFSGHFLGLHAHGGVFNVGGIAYGYDLIFSSHWNHEFEIGAGYAYLLYDQYECEVCGSILAEDLTHHYFGITKAAVSLVFLF